MKPRERLGEARTPNGTTGTPPCGFPQTIARSRPGSRGTAPGIRIALEGLTYDRTANAVTYRSDESEGPMAGTEKVDPLAFPVVGFDRQLTLAFVQGQAYALHGGWRPVGRR